VSSPRRIALSVLSDGAVGTPRPTFAEDEDQFFQFRLSIRLRLPYIFLPAS